MKLNNIINKIVEFQLIISVLVIFSVAVCLYLSVALAAVSRNRAAEIELKEKRVEIKKLLAEPPTRERITELVEEKEMLETQYIEMIRKMGFFQPDPLPNFPLHFDGMEMEPLLDLLGIRIFRDYFEKELKKREIRLRHLGDECGIAIPSRLGFEEEEPESPQALALLLAGVGAVEKLITTAIDAGVCEIPSIEVAALPYEEGITTEFKKLNIGLTLKAEALPLIEFLDRLATGKYFFIIEEMEITSTAPPELEVKLSISTQIFLGEEI